MLVINRYMTMAFVSPEKLDEIYQAKTFTLLFFTHDFFLLQQQMTQIADKTQDVSRIITKVATM